MELNWNIHQNMIVVLVASSHIMCLWPCILSGSCLGKRYSWFDQSYNQSIVRVFTSGFLFLTKLPVQKLSFYTKHSTSFFLFYNLSYNYILILIHSFVFFLAWCIFCRAVGQLPLASLSCLTLIYFELCG